MAGGEVSLRVPHAPAGFHLVRHQFLGVVHLHGAVDDAVSLHRFEVAHLQHHHLEKRERIQNDNVEMPNLLNYPPPPHLDLKGKHDVGLGEGGDVHVVVRLRARHLALCPGRRNRKGGGNGREMRGETKEV